MSSPHETPALPGVPGISRSLLGHTTFADNLEPTKNKQNNNNNNNKQLTNAKAQAKGVVKQMAMSLAQKGLRYGAKQVIKRTGGRQGGGTQSVALPAQVNINTTTSSTAPVTENFTWSIIPKFPGTAINVPLHMSPFNFTTNSNIVWSPMLLAAANKHREFRVKKCVLKLSGGASTTVSGQLLLCSSQDPTVPMPTPEGFTFMEKNAKLNIATPGSFAVGHDHTWHSIKDVTDINGEAELKLFTAGVAFIYFSPPSTGIEALKLDIDLTMEFRGRNPSYNVTQEDATIMLAENAGVVGGNSVLPEVYRLSRRLTTAKREYQLPMGAVRVRTIRVHRGTVAPEIKVIDKIGADVTALRVLCRQKIYSTAISYYLEYLNVPGGAYTTVRGPSASDNLCVEELYMWVDSTDFISLLNDTNVGATIADSKLCDVQVEQITVRALNAAGRSIGNGVTPTWVDNLPVY